MFFKLFKYDFKAISRSQIPVLLAFLCLTVLGCLNAGVMCVSMKYEADFMGMISAGGFMLTLTAFAGLIMVMSLLIYVRFYKSTVTDEAYTTFTLPVKPSQILGAKFLSAVLWNFLIVVVYIAAALLMVLTVMACSMSGSDLSLFRAEWNIILQTLDIGVDTVLIVILGTLVSSVSQTLQIYTAILFGASVVRRYKAFAAVGMYFVVNFIVSLVTSAFGFASGTAFSSDFMSTDFSTAFHSIMLVQTVLMAVIAVICWCICVWLMKHKVNLE